MTISQKEMIPLINSFNPIQLSAWHANVDMQYRVSKNKVIAYCAKHATKINVNPHLNHLNRYTKVL